ncbi:MAG TPA: GDSL-type esterase/lipase family protein [Candidatus Saccharimonadales bacterium]|nr:GDSL-type esterase/lipase family protein [Candidatus Saccharimonadales bacterium]
MRVLVFGDSITQGFWDSRGGWAARLRAAYDEVRLKDPNLDAPLLFNLGICGETSEELCKRIEPEIVARRSHQGDSFAFVIASGMNDTKIEDGAVRSSPEAYRQHVTEVIWILRQHADVSKVLLVGLTPVDEARTAPTEWNPSVSLTNNRIREFDAVLREVATQSGASYVPVFEEFQKQPNWRTLLLDGLHPSDAGHQLMFKLIQPALQKILAT